jgi:hypothetical protein
MAITSKAQLETGLNSRFSRLYLTKTPFNPTNSGVGFNHSYWYSTAGTPASGLAPNATVAALNHLTTGAIPFMQQTSPRTSYLANLNATVSNAASITENVEIHDRLIQITVASVSTTALTVTGFDLNSFLGTNNIGNRIGDANYSDVQWWVEMPADGTGTSSNLTISVIYNDGTTGNLTAITGFTNRRQGRMYPLNNLIPAADSGKYIRAITSVVGSANSAGAIAFVATRYRAAMFLETFVKSYNSGWTELGLPEIYNQSCLFVIALATGTAVGVINLDGLIVHG